MGGSEGQLKPWWQDWSTRFRSPVSPHVAKRRSLRSVLVRSRRTVETFILLTVAVLVGQTWCLEGVLDPFEVSSGSMAETPLGPHWDVVCDDCGLRSPTAPICLGAAKRQSVPIAVTARTDCRPKRRFPAIDSWSTSPSVASVPRGDGKWRPFAVLTERDAST